MCQQVRCQTCPKTKHLSLHTWLGGNSVSTVKVSNLPKKLYTCLCTPAWEGILCQQVRCQTCPKAIHLSLHTWLGGNSVSTGKVSHLPTDLSMTLHTWLGAACVGTPLWPTAHVNTQSLSAQNPWSYRRIPLLSLEWVRV